MYTIKDGCVYERINNEDRKIVRIEPLVDLANRAEELAAKNAAMEKIVNLAVEMYARRVNTIYCGDWNEFIDNASGIRRSFRTAVRDYVAAQNPKPQFDLAPIKELVGEMKSALDKIESGVTKMMEAK